MAPLTAEEFQGIFQSYEGLYSYIRTHTSPEEPLLLAHYTSVETAEKILKNEEIWFSNPLYMNDLEEMVAGLRLGAQLFPEYAQKAESQHNRQEILTHTFTRLLAHLDSHAAIDTYVFCLCEHNHPNGLLSMWREYGRKGNGVAFVFDTQRVTYQPHNPLIIAKVIYSSEKQREQQLRTYLDEWVRITQSHNLSDDRLHLAAVWAFQFVKAVALTTKHDGFAEENEWRVIYIPERDPLGYLKQSLDYSIGRRGVEPKLKAKLGTILYPAPPATGAGLSINSLSDILKFIVLGPSVSSPLAKISFERMLHHLNKGSFRYLVTPSTIPLRPEW